MFDSYYLDIINRFKVDNNNLRFYKPFKGSFFQGTIFGYGKKLLLADLSDKDMTDDKYFICDTFFIGDILY